MHGDRAQRGMPTAIGHQTRGGGVRLAGVGLTELTEHVAQAFDVAGAVVLVLGFLWSLAVAIREWARAGGGDAYRKLRTTFGGALLLGLEILVAADLIR